MTSAEREQLSREEWQRTPHAYVVDYPRYPCVLCGCWPGYPIHQETPAGSGAPDPEPAGHHRQAS